MKTIALGSLLFCVSALSVLAADTGYIQVKSPPGIAIFLDGDFKGKTNSELGGIILEDVKPGPHRIKAAKTGFVPKEATITVKSGSVVKWEVGSFAPRIMAEESGEEKKDGYQANGSMIVQSVPIEMTVEIPSLGVRYAKGKDKLKLSPIPVGKYAVTFSGLGKKVESQITIYDKMATELFVNLLKGTVTNKMEEKLASYKAALEKIGEKPFTVPGLEMEMLWCEPGTFEMGSPESEEDRELFGTDETQHTVTLTKGFWLGEHEVTQAQWQAVMGTNSSTYKGANLPVEKVSWEDATAFCKKLTERERNAGRLPVGWAFALPTEAQWEYACRAGTKTAYAFGAAITEKQANFKRNIGKTTSVGSYPANAWGFHDMHGNVYEWCHDWYGKYPTGSVTDPMGPASGSNRVKRGGSWHLDGHSLRSAKRYYYAPGPRNSNLGFRVGFRFIGE